MSSTRQNSHKTEPFIRKCSKSSNGWNNADIDTVIVLFRGGLVFDGDLPSKDARSRLASFDYVDQGDGWNTLTGKGKIAALFYFPMPFVWYRIWKRNKRNPFK